MSGQLHAPVALPTEKELPVPIGKDAGWTSESVWATRERNGHLQYVSNSDDFKSEGNCILLIRVII
jgi:hypothetical protein